MASGVKDPGASAGVLNSLRSTAGPNTALEATGHSVRFLSDVGLYYVARASAWPFGIKEDLGWVRSLAGREFRLMWSNKY